MNYEDEELHRRLHERWLFYNGMEPQMYDNMVPQGEGAKDIGLGISSAKYRDKIVAELNHLKREIARREEMLKLLDENPAIEKFMDLSRR